MKTTVIVPTFDEGENVHALLQRLDAALSGLDADVLIVDDGSDDLPERVAALAPDLRIAVRVDRRAEPVGRLGGAVVDGMRASDADLFVVMDGDLQHPPELVPQLIAEASSADVVVATRYLPGGTAGGLSGGVRRAVSRVSGALSRAVLPERVRRCTDPMSGFFAVRRSAVDLEGLRPRGFKILLEILVRSRPARVSEVPFAFGERLAGESHAGVAEGWRFLAQLVALRAATSPTAARALRFAAVGASGVLPNLLSLWLLESAGVGYLLAAILAVQVSIAWNFVGADLVVWRGRSAAQPRWRRFLWFAAFGETDLLRLPFVVLLVEGVHLGTPLATVLTLVAAFLVRFLLADRIVYRAAPVVVDEPVVAGLAAEPAA